MKGRSGALEGQSQEAYRYALGVRVFPVFDVDFDDWPDELGNDEEYRSIYIEWRVSPWAMNSLYHQLLAAANNDASSFYRFERSLWSSPWTIRMSRDCVFDACKYFFIKGIFPKSFWHRFCRRGEAPMEAFDVISGNIN